MMIPPDPEKQVFHTNSPTGCSSGPGSPILHPVSIPWRYRWAVRKVFVMGLAVALGLMIGSWVWWGYIPGLWGWPQSWVGGMTTPQQASIVPLSDPAQTISSPSPLLSWAHSLSPFTLTSNLSPLPTSSQSYPAYTSQIEELISLLPLPLQLAYRAENLTNYGWDHRKFIWQTDKDRDKLDGFEVMSWREGSANKEGWEWELMTDETATAWVKRNLAGTVLELVWDNMPSGILNSDLLRYLLLAFKGGIYSDTDTTLLKPPSSWGRGADLWKGGEGWLSTAEVKRIEDAPDRDIEMDRLLGRPGLVVGIEADVGDREDWAEWWPRQLQIAQWTMASTIFHPVPLSALLRIIHNTATAITFSQAHYANYAALLSSPSATPADIDRLSRIDVLSEPVDGGPLGVINWTGPSVWTDAVLAYLEARYGMEWTELKGLKKPLRVGDVVILPVTGFSPGVGNFGAGNAWDEQAMVEHNFRGSWKHHD